ncbi:hypothetical protein IMG5_001200 [Ichthyophthirius multifiliis]|uniref:3-oxoacyl-[acyl-carrier-protein] reductase n=1 Tax=Ichthyophthirius multifiliis TaxID=5932 RepID=G0QIR1_ICHMU|nr:hypothetical protein IMG5_001200 [Ichthyophthirius multifiliis]EGR34891.1 hypothetical protein IMG5_001200 [Ichthyophthirius multifiliis]|eukprot:XP_004040195.1 hypothetical protein IMG5_001200 [Ichthyophthirius multifiliis]
MINFELDKREQIKQMIDYVFNKYRKIDILINNNIFEYDEQKLINTFIFIYFLINNIIFLFFYKSPDDIYDKLIKQNMTSYFYSMKYVIPYMEKQNWGRIINISSVEVGQLQKSAFTATQHAILGMTKVAALETARSKVSINCICPGIVYSDLQVKKIKLLMQDKNITYNEAKLQIINNKQPTQDFIYPEQISDVALFLCQNSSQEIRGEAISVDGGWTAQ